MQTCLHDYSKVDNFKFEQRSENARKRLAYLSNANAVHCQISQTSNLLNCPPTGFLDIKYKVNILYYTMHKKYKHIKIYTLLYYTCIEKIRYACIVK